METHGETRNLRDTLTMAKRRRRSSILRLEKILQELKPNFIVFGVGCPFYRWKPPLGGFSSGGRMLASVERSSQRVGRGWAMLAVEMEIGTTRLSSTGYKHLSIQNAKYTLDLY